MQEIKLWEWWLNLKLEKKKKRIMRTIECDTDVERYLDKAGVLSFSHLAQDGLSKWKKNVSLGLFCL